MMTWLPVLKLETLRNLIVSFAYLLSEPLSSIEKYGLLMRIVSTTTSKTLHSCHVTITGLLLDGYENALRNKLDEYASMKRRMITLRPSPFCYMDEIREEKKKALATLAIISLVP